MAYTTKILKEKRRKKKNKKKNYFADILSRMLHADAVILFRSFVLGGFCRGCCAFVGTVVLLGGADAVRYILFTMSGFYRGRFHETCFYYADISIFFYADFLAHTHTNVHGTRNRGRKRVHVRIHDKILTCLSSGALLVCAAVCWPGDGCRAILRAWSTVPWTVLPQYISATARTHSPSHRIVDHPRTTALQRRASVGHGAERERLILAGFLAE